MKTKYTKRNLQQTSKLVLVLNGAVGMNQSALVAEGTIAANQYITGDSFAKHLNLQRVGNNFLSFAVNVGMNQSNVIIARNNIAQCTKTLFNSLNGNRIWKGIS